LIIITSDHGENIDDHGLMDHQLCLYDTLLKVPLIIIGPGFPQGKRYTKQIQLHQIYHTIIRAVHAEWKVKNFSHTLSLQEMIKIKMDSYSHLPNMEDQIKLKTHIPDILLI